MQGDITQTQHTIVSSSVPFNVTSLWHMVLADCQLVSESAKHTDKPAAVGNNYLIDENP